MWTTIWKLGYIISDNKGLISITSLLRAKRRKLSLSEFFTNTQYLTTENVKKKYQNVYI